MSNQNNIDGVNIDDQPPSKDFLTAAVLSVLLGGFGVDRFYLAKAGTGFLKLITFGGFGIWYFIDLLLILTGNIQDKFGRPLKDRKKNIKPALIVVAIVLFLWIWGMTSIAAAPDNTSNYASPDEEKVNLNEKETVQPANYKMYDTKDLSDPNSKKVQYNLVVSTSIKKKQVKPTAEKAKNDITEQDDEIDELILNIYSNKGNIGGRWDVAQAIWAPQGDLGNVTPAISRSNDRSDYKMSLDIKENLEEHLAQQSKSENKFGFTEEERKQIYKDIIAAEDRAMKEAEQQYPTNLANADAETVKANLDKNRELTDKLTEKYTKKVLDKYGIDEEIELAIGEEALDENWPTE